MPLVIFLSSGAGISLSLEISFYVAGGTLAKELREVDVRGDSTPIFF